MPYESRGPDRDALEANLAESSSTRRTTATRFALQCDGEASMSSRLTDETARGPSSRTVDRFDGIGDVGRSSGRSPGSRTSVDLSSAGIEARRASSPSFTSPASSSRFGTYETASTQLGSTFVQDLRIEAVVVDHEIEHGLCAIGNEVIGRLVVLG